MHIFRLIARKLLEIHQVFLRRFHTIKRKICLRDLHTRFNQFFPKNGGIAINIKILALGRLKEKYLTEAMNEYEKRLSAFCKFEVIELEPQRLPENPSEAEISAALESEADKLFLKIPAQSAVIALCIEGKQLSSPALAKKISDFATDGIGTVVFVIGSSFGLSECIKKAANLRLSMSEMTFPHQLARVMLTEQIYRAFTIINNRKYHK